MKKYSTRKKNEVIKLVKDGTKVTDVSRKTGISRQTIYRWLSENTNNSNHRPLTYGILKKYSEKLENVIKILKYSQPPANLTRKERYDFITKLSEHYNINTLCEALDIPKGSYYNHLLRNKNANNTYAKHRDEIVPLVDKIFHESNEIYGAKKISKLIKEMGYTASTELVTSIMKENGWFSVRGGAKTQFEKEKRLKKNILAQEFTVSRPNEVWVGDVTYFNFKQKQYYICVIIDLYARKVIACRVSLRNSTQLTKTTFKEAYIMRKPKRKLMFHSDRGGNYTSKAFMNYLSSLGITQSFSSPGVPYDNSVVESFFKNMKTEELYRTKYRSEYEFRTAVTNYIKFYNSERPHKSNGYHTPDKMEEIYFKSKKENVT